MDAASSGRVTPPKSPPRVLLSLDLEPSSPPLLEKLGLEDEEFGSKVRGVGFANGFSTDMALASEDARSAFAFGLNMSPNAVLLDPSEDI